MKRGEQIRFVLKNDGEPKTHEFMLATHRENLKHAEQMKKYPEMEHDDPNGKTIAARRPAPKFSGGSPSAGEFEYACLIPGHREAGMTGKIVVK